MGNVSLCRPNVITLEIAQMGVMKPTVQVRMQPIFSLSTFERFCQQNLLSLMLQFSYS